MDKTITNLEDAIKNVKEQCDIALVEILRLKVENENNKTVENLNKIIKNLLEGKGDKNGNRDGN